MEDRVLDVAERCAPNDEQSVDTRIALVTGKISLDEAIAEMGMDDVLRILGES